jgi:hypothetical protein
MNSFVSFSFLLENKGFSSLIIILFSGNYTSLITSILEIGKSSSLNPFKILTNIL